MSGAVCRLNVLPVGVLSGVSLIRVRPLRSGHIHSWSVGNVICGRVPARIRFDANSRSLVIVILGATSESCVWIFPLSLLCDTVPLYSSRWTSVMRQTRPLYGKTRLLSQKDTSSIQNCHKRSYETKYLYILTLVHDLATVKIFQWFTQVSDFYLSSNTNKNKIMLLWSLGLKKQLSMKIPDCVFIGMNTLLVSSKTQWRDAIFISLMRPCDFSLPRCDVAFQLNDF